MAPLNGDNFYRLKQIDIDGRHIYSPLVKQNISSTTHLKLRGNPVQKQLKVVFYGTTNGTLQLIITDALGAVIIRKTVAAKAGSNEITIPLVGIKSGLYYLQAFCGNWKEVLKFSRL